jgi:hypothetical protein
MVTDIKTIEEISMKKPNPVVDLLAIAYECIKASMVRARLLHVQNKRSLKKKQQEDCDVNIVDRENWKEPEQKERRSFRCPTDAKKWCEIHRTSGHDLEECGTYLNHKKKEDESVAPEPHRGNHCLANSDNDEQLK